MLKLSMYGEEKKKWKCFGLKERNQHAVAYGVTVLTSAFDIDNAHFKWV